MYLQSHLVVKYCKVLEGEKKMGNCEFLTQTVNIPHHLTTYYLTELKTSDIKDPVYR
jgi:hypothetical protein